MNRIVFKVVSIKKNRNFFSILFYITVFLIFFCIALDFSGVFLKVLTLVTVIFFVCSVVFNGFILKYDVIGSVEIHDNCIIYINDKIHEQISFDKEDIFHVRIEYDGFQGEDYSILKWINIKSGVNNVLKINCLDRVIRCNILIESIEKMEQLNAFLKSNKFIYEIRNMNNLKLLFDKDSLASSSITHKKRTSKKTYQQP